MPISYRSVVDAQGDLCLSRFDHLKTFLLHATNFSFYTRGRFHFMSLEVRANCIVAIMAELEALTRVFVNTANQQINEGKHPILDLKACLRPLAGHSSFESLVSLRKAGKVWETRARVTNFEVNNDTACLPVLPKSPVPPLDGRTLTFDHFKRIWQVYSISGEPDPTFTWVSTLNQLAEQRNDIAHANSPIEAVLKTKGGDPKAIEDAISKMSGFVIHLLDKWGTYLDNREYLL